MKLTIVTGNQNKAKEIGAILGIEVEAHKLDIPEIQSYALQEIVKAKVLAAYEAFSTPVAAEDVSFHLGVLDGFPGPFVKFWEENIGYDFVVDLIAKAGNDRVMIRCGAGYYDGKDFEYVEGEISGRIVPKAGDTGFGFDPYVIPDGFDQTFAQLGPEKKNEISHRVKAWTAMRELLLKRGAV